LTAATPGHLHPLYNNQINPGAAQVVHYQFTVPPDLRAPSPSRSSSSTGSSNGLLQLLSGQGWTNGMPFHLTNDLPIVTICADTVTFPIAGAPEPVTRQRRSQIQSPIANRPSEIRNPALAALERLRDRAVAQGRQGQREGRAHPGHARLPAGRGARTWDGPVNLARVYYKEGRLDDAVKALQRAAKAEPPAPRWLVAGSTPSSTNRTASSRAVKELTSIVEDQDPALRERGFDFSRDYEVLNELGQTSSNLPSGSATTKRSNVPCCATR